MIVDMEKVEWLPKTWTSRKSRELLDEWSALIGQKADPPIPVEAVAENYLGISVEYDDLEEMLGMPDVLGATWVEEKKMVINSSLLDGNEGRISFTCSHEIGHWILHRKYLQSFKRMERSSSNESPAVVCRASAFRARGEWQADYFSSCLLMPKEAVEAAYREAFGPDPLVMYNERSCFNPRNPLALDPAHDSAKEIAWRVMDAGNFMNVSKEAMCYRLLDLGLLVNQAGKPLAQSLEANWRREVERRKGFSPEFMSQYTR